MGNKEKGQVEKKRVYIWYKGVCEMVGEKCCGIGMW